MTKTEYGTITVTIGDQPYKLIPSLKAVRAIEGHFQGLRGAVDACQNMSIDAAAFIVAAGADLKPKEANALAEAIWEEGILEVIPQVMKYLNALLIPREALLDEEDAPGNVKKLKTAVTVQ